MNRIHHNRAPRLVALLFAAVALGPGGAGEAAGQTWTGAVVDAATGGPVRGAFVTLEIDGRSAVRQMLTGEGGRFTVQPPGDAAGVGRGWTLSVQMLGYATFEQTGVVGDAGVVHIEVALEPRPLILDGIEAATRSDRQCSPLGPDDGTLLAHLWEEARKTLERAAWGQGEGGYRFVLRNHEREINPTTLAVIAERTGNEFTASEPFSSPGAAELNRVGWARWDPPGSRGGFVLYDGPDPEALLSDEFQASHCFSVRLHRDRPEQVGIRFEPETPGGGPVGISGTVWLDRASGELRSLVYTYTSFPGFTDDPEGVILPEFIRLRLGGELHFRTFPRGEVVVDRWHIRMPLQTVRGVIIREDGGVLLRALTPEGLVVGGEEGAGGTGDPR